MSESIVVLQKRDHAELDRLLERYEADAPAGRRETFRKIVNLVTTHAFAEEEVLFPAARRALGVGEHITAEIESEHQRINELLKEMEPLVPGDTAFEQRVSELFPLLRLDVRNEEDRLLGALERALDEKALRRIGVAWLLAKKAAPNRGHPAIPRRPPGNLLAGIPLFFVDRLRALFARWRHAPQ
ncbi:Hemerythrin HHE cation binding domain-containing protein [Stigmatella aurantiaca]|uniref:Hemerythrin HHE cation binding domain-containing protein n=1 Tax=Stigmatella aurantiaca TaxID=41 RepID=A0A1H8DIY0_STIAU|nr:hemerythrin domain-containing protein [Stigmatella aurantiaca]SEN07173.1 Hemerythrin HHE cation binding domain-containing protein [Stigmatella aurantiaca]